MKNRTVEIRALFMCAVTLAAFTTLQLFAVEAKHIEPNPTEYVYNADFNRVVSLLNTIPKWSERFREFFLISSNVSRDKSEFHIELRNAGPVNNYLFYYEKDTPLPYYAVFLISATKQADLETKVAITVLDSYVVIPGHGFNIHTFRFDQGKPVLVKPTTIEEYELLLSVGAELRQAGMPKISVPN